MEYEESEQNRTPVDFKKFSSSFQVLSDSRCNPTLILMVKMFSLHNDRRLLNDTLSKMTSSR
jgi:hypothetical protein